MQCHQVSRVLNAKVPHCKFFDSSASLLLPSDSKSIGKVLKGNLRNSKESGRGMPIKKKKQWNTTSNQKNSQSIKKELYLCWLIIFGKCTNWHHGSGGYLQIHKLSVLKYLLIFSFSSRIFPKEIQMYIKIIIPVICTIVKNGNIFNFHPYGINWIYYTTFIWYIIKNTVQVLKVIMTN